MYSERFSSGAVSADLINSFGNALAYSAFLSAFGLSEVVKTTRKGELAEPRLSQYTRYFCLIAAYSRDVTGLGDWQPPSLYADADAIRASAAQFLHLADQELILIWVEQAIRVMRGTAALVPEDERGTGNPEEDPLLKRENESPSGS